MKSNLQKSSWHCFISVAILFGLHSCSESKYFLLGKKYSYYKDYSDTEKENYYVKNKTILDSVTELASGKIFSNFISFKPNGDSSLNSSPGSISFRFLDTVTIHKNALWLEYINKHKEDSIELSQVFFKMDQLFKRLHPLFRNQFKERSILISYGSIYIPLKKIIHDNYLGDDTYSYLIVLAPGKVNIDKLKASYNEYPAVRILTDHLLTNENVKR
ncbi:hypothetical protein [Ferruginibacter sp. SUN106]|uniref:hypothetical protein n=1 Tax=Ferruginibacter sp. SUN106 TaxID=2978348 RepID=UPI003D36B69C